MPVIICIDAETDGLYGPPFSIGAVEVNETGREIATFSARLPDAMVTDSWVRRNVLPALLNAPVTHGTLDAMLADFAAWWMPRKCQITIADCGSPVESGLFRLLVERGHIGAFDGPFPLHEVATLRLARGMDDTITGPPVDIAGTPHDPLYDARVSAAQWRVLAHD